MDQRHRHDVAEIRMPGGTLLIGTPTDPEITFWQKATGQERLSALAGHQLRRSEDAAPQLRRLTDRVGLCSHRPYLTDAALGETIRQAIDSRRLSAVFLPNVAPPEPMQIHLTLASPRGGEQAPRFDFARATRAERVTEMLRRTPPLLKGQIKQTVDGMLSSGSVAMLGASLAAVAAAHLLGVGEAFDAALAGFAFITAGWAGLVALKDIIVATVEAAKATRDAELDEAAQQFAGGLLVLGEGFLEFLLTKQLGGGGAAKNNIAIKSAASGTSRKAVQRRFTPIASKGITPRNTFSTSQRSIAAQDIRKARKLLRTAGLNRAQRNEVIQSFHLDTFRVENTAHDTKAYRLFDDTTARLEGRYASGDFFPNQTDRIQNLALMGNSATRLGEVMIPRGSVIFTGRVASQLRFSPGLTGGANQTFLTGPLNRYIFHEVLMPR